jgi:hypothetical protein
MKLFLLLLVVGMFFVNNAMASDSEVCGKITSISSNDEYSFKSERGGYVTIGRPESYFKLSSPQQQGEILKLGFASNKHICLTAGEGYPNTYRNVVKVRAEEN